MLRLSCRSMDHPRIRGEHNPHLDTAKGSGGSSPHTRGALQFREPFSLAVRIIPAYAGSTRSDVPHLHLTPDHPRIRGEHGLRLDLDEGGGGSSPHTRGAHQRAPVCERHQGIIPAYAGSTAGEGVDHRERRDHPRIRGEHE